MQESTHTYDVAIIGGGPAGSSVGSILKKYEPDLSVAIFERENFPRDHVGESLLPLIGVYLDEMGVWNKVEAANFPIKIGATYRWGSTPDLWNFEFLPNGEFKEDPRPGIYQGQRVKTSFQVDRAVYDKIPLDHARELGCEVYEGTRIAEVSAHGDRVIGMTARSSEDKRIEARYYVDCSANSAILRKKMGVEVESPTALRNVAMWDYWRNAEWAVEVGVGGTRIQVLSLGYGWVWFIPLGPDRTSVGFVVPAEYLKLSGKRPFEIYEEALKEESRVAKLLRNAKPEGQFQTTNDWSILSARLYGANWFLAGDTCGFADPILSAGLTLAHASAREVAYILLHLLRHGESDSEWLKSSYEETHRRRIWQHIRFADYWYGANAQFTDLVAFCSEIAKDAGLELDPDQAFQWLGTGGFANDDIGQASVGAYTLPAVKRITQLFSGKKASWRLNEINELRLDMAGLRIEERPHFDEGQIYRARALVRDKMVLPLTGPFALAYAALQHHRDLREIAAFLKSRVPTGPHAELAFFAMLAALEGMLAEGWIKGSVNKKGPIGLGLPLNLESAGIRFDSSTTEPCKIRNFHPLK